MRKKIGSTDERLKRGAGEGTTVPAAARSMALFEVFARERRELTKSELARLMDLPESSCSDLLNTLYDLGYVSRTAASKRYYPTGRLLNAATLITENDPLGLFGNEAASLLGQKVDETCTFGIVDGANAKLLSVYEGTHRLRYVVNAGDRVSLHGTALGKAMLGALPAQERAGVLRLQPLRRLTESTTTEVAKLEKEIEKSRARGWYQAREESAADVWSIAISGLVGTTPVGLSMVGPADRMRDNEQRYVDAILEVRATLFERDRNGHLDQAAPRPRGRPRRNP
jgi:DNA-binding IclR family transcriptional regulator